MGSCQPGRSENPAGFSDLGPRQTGLHTSGSVCLSGATASVLVIWYSTSFPPGGPAHKRVCWCCLWWHAGCQCVLVLLAAKRRVWIQSAYRNKSPSLLFHHTDGVDKKIITIDTSLGQSSSDWGILSCLRKTRSNCLSLNLALADFKLRDTLRTITGCLFSLCWESRQRYGHVSATRGFVFTISKAIPWIA